MNEKRLRRWVIVDGIALFISMLSMGYGVYIEHVLIASVSGIWMLYYHAELRWDSYLLKRERQAQAKLVGAHHLDS